MLNLWKRDKRSNSKTNIGQDSIERSRGSVSIPVYRNNSKVSEHSARRSTISTMSTLHSRSIGTLNTLRSSQEHIHNLEKHYRRRPALISGGSCDSDDEPNVVSFVTVSVDSNNVDAIPIPEGSNLGDVILSAFHKRSHSITLESLSKYKIFAFRNGVSLEANLDDPAVDFQASVVRLQPNDDSSDESDDYHSCGTPDYTSANCNTIECCLQFFNEHGLKNLPSNDPTNNDDSFPLPRVEPIGDIDSSWEELPIDPRLRKSLTPSEHSQQQAIWELISTEHSHLKQLEVVINLFMRTLELIRRAELLRDVNYHNIFGYMKDIYSAHLLFWNSTLQPLVEKVHIQQGILDLNSFISLFPANFGQDFDIYEQHCPFEQINLRSLDDAVEKCADFRKYLEWCERQPECNRLRLKDYLAKPMQRLTKYKLLISRILKKTLISHQAEELEEIVAMVSDFVDSVNSVLQVQEETARVEEVMKKISGYSAVEIASEFKDLVQPYSKLDLLAPMPNVEISRSRFLMLEGRLRFRDNHSKASLHVSVFLFTDMLLVTKMTRRSDKHIVIRPPYKVSSLQVTLREQGLICCVVVDEFNVASVFFTLKANSVAKAQVWTEQIELAKELYNSAIEQKAQSWQLLQSLRGERMVDGSQDLLEVSSNHRRMSCQSVGSMGFSDSNLQDEPQRRQRSNTLPHNTFMSTLPQSLSIDDPKTITSPPIKWKRVGSLNTLAERHYNVSSLLENYNCHPLPRAPYEAFSTAGHHVATQTDPCDIIPLISQDLASCPLQVNSQSTIDEADMSLSGSLSPLPPFQTNSHYTPSASSQSLSSNIPEKQTAYEDEYEVGYADNNYSHADDEFLYPRSSLMSEIMSELHESSDVDYSFPSDTCSLGPETHNQRPSLMKLDWIDEDDMYYTPPSLFARNSNLRKSKSSMELSMYRRRHGSRNLSYLSASSRGDFFPSPSPLSVLSPSPIQEAEEEPLSPPQSPSKSQTSLHRLKQKLSFRGHQRSGSQKKEKQDKPKKPTKRVKSASSSHSARGWGLISMIRNKWRSTESGLHKPDLQQLTKKDHQLLVHETPIRKGSPRTMRVMRSPHQPHTKHSKLTTL